MTTAILARVAVMARHGWGETQGNHHGNKVVLAEWNDLLAD